MFAFYVGCEPTARGVDALAPCAPLQREVMLLDRRLSVETRLGTHTRVFDPQSVPRFRVPSGSDGAWSVHVAASSTAGTAQFTLPLVRGGSVAADFVALLGLPAERPWHFLESKEWRELSPGPVTLTVRRSAEGCSEVEVAQFEVEWDHAPLAGPLAFVPALKAEGRHAEIEQRVRQILPSLPDHRRFWAQAELARSFGARGEFERAARAWLDASEVARERRAWSQVAWGLESAGYFQSVMRRLWDAAATFEQAAALHVQIDDPQGEALGAYHRGALAWQVADYRAAERAYRLAIERTIDTDDLKQLLIYSHGLAQVFFFQARLTEALALNDAVIRGAERRKDEALLAHAHGLKALVLARSVDLEARPSAAGLARARQSFETSIALNRRLNIAAQLGEDLVNLARLDVLAGDLPRAAAHLQELEGVVGASDLENPFVLLVQGEAAFAGGDKKRARERLERAMTEGRRLAIAEISDDVWMAQHALARLELEEGNTRRAIELLNDADLRIEDLARRSHLRGGRSAFYGQRRRLSEDLVALLLRSGDVVEAFRVSDRAHARVIGELETQLRSERLPPARRAAFAERLGEVLRERDAFEANAAEHRLLAGKALRRWEQERRAKLTLQQRRVDELYAILDEHAPSSAPVTDPAALVRWLGRARAAVVSFIRVGDRWTSFWVSGRGVAAREVTSTAGATWADRYAEVEAIFVVPGGMDEARALPFERLADGQLALERATFSLLPFAGLLEPRETATSTRVVIVTDPDGSLPNARAEGSAVKALLPGSELWVGAAAKRATLMERLPGAGLFHFAGHAVMSAGDPWRARLELADGEALTLEDLMLLRSPPRRAVLNGCQTGGLRETSAVSIALPEVLLAMGTEGVLATEVAIDDRVAVRFVDRFYRAGGPAAGARAYREAMLAALAGGDDGACAFRWFGRN